MAPLISTITSVLLFLAVIAPGATAQVNAIYVSPEEPTTADEIVFHFEAGLACVNYQTKVAVFGATEDTFFVDFYANLEGMCMTQPELLHYADTIGHLDEGWYYLRASAEDSTHYPEYPIYTQTMIDSFFVSYVNPCESGNVNGVGGIDLTDVIYLTGFLFLNGPAPPRLAQADVNGSSGVDLADVIYLLNFLFLGGPDLVPCD